MRRRRNLCAECGKPVVAFRPRRKRVVRAMRDHDLCQRCWKSVRDRERKVPVKQ